MRITDRKYLIIPGLIIVVGIVEEVLSALFVFNGLLKYIPAIIGTMLITIIFFFIVKGVDKTVDELGKNKKRLKNIFESLDVAIWSHDLKTDTLLITQGIEKLYGYSSKDFYEDSSLWKKVIHPEDMQVLAEREKKLAKGEPVTSIYRIFHSDGEVRWIQDRGIPILDAQGNFVDFTSVLFDITDRKESEDRYRSLVEMSPDIIAVFSRGKIDYINEAGCKLFGANGPGELIGRAISTIIPMSTLDQIKSMDLQVEEDQEEIIRLEFQVNQSNGETIDIEMSTMPILFEGRLAKQIIGRDITERKKAEKTIEYMAYYDALTGLSNRNMFIQYLSEALKQPNSQTLAVLFMDLDRFKIINDTKGHTIGDIILKKVAERLEGTIEEQGMVSRHGGDEFVIFLENAAKDKVTKVAQDIIDKFSKPIILDNQEFYVTTSIGISLFPTDGKDEETLIKHADIAMYNAKKLGKNNFQFYSSHLDGHIIRKMEIENDLRKALDQKQMHLNYQPQFNLETERIVGIEALIRWKHPVHGFISPAEFIPLAEETGFIVPLGKWILQTAVKQNKKWQEEGLAVVPIAVNISVRQMQEEHFIDLIAECLNESGLNPAFLELEITETIMQNIEMSISILNRLKKIGVKISIDDFGTGYSSLSYLKHLPIDTIKIDKSFVDDIVDHNHQGAIVKTIIDMGNNLNFSVIAEGIETEEQVKFLRNNACRVGQGYYYSKPLPAEEIKSLLID